MNDQKEELILATRNPHKQKELTEIFKGIFKKILTLNDFPQIPETIEDSETFEANALKKAFAVSSHTKSLTLADDSGLIVNALSGEPGIHSKRYSGENATYQSNINKLLHRLQGIPLKERKASFVCCMALVRGDKIISVVEEKCSGLILEKIKGKGGFAYDPIFFYPPSNKTFAEMSEQEKNNISHRYKAGLKIIHTLKHSEKIFSHNQSS